MAGGTVCLPTSAFPPLSQSTEEKEGWSITERPGGKLQPVRPGKGSDRAARDSNHCRTCKQSGHIVLTLTIDPTFLKSDASMG